MSFLSIATRHQIRAVRQTMSASAVAEKYGISRQRVYQILADDPSTWREFRRVGNRCVWVGADLTENSSAKDNPRA